MQFPSSDVFHDYEPLKLFPQKRSTLYNRNFIIHSREGNVVSVIVLQLKTWLLIITLDEVNKSLGIFVTLLWIFKGLKSFQVYPSNSLESILN